jgi:predicted homoserine dehydrogenase-like protein
MYLHADLMRRAAEGRPVRVCLIGAGKFGAMFLAQVPTTPGLAVTVIADLRPDGARAACRAVGWSEDRIAATAFTDDAAAAIARDDVDVVVEATGHPRAGAAHARACFAAGKHVVMVNVEADALVGPALAREAASAGVVFSMAYGDQPALVCEMVEWARCCGFEVVAAGKGTRYLPVYHESTPATVWDHYGLSAEQACAAGMNSKMFNSFLDGTKSALEMAAIANACGLDAPEDGLAFPPCGAEDLAHVLRPRVEGGQLPGRGMVEVVSSLERDGRSVPRDLRWGVYVVFAAPTDYAAACFRQYGMNTDASGRYSAMFKPFHLIGLELNVSILSAALDGRPTGATRGWRGDVVATAKRDLKAGETLDGEGGETVWGKLVPAQRSSAERLCPIGMAQDVRLLRDVPRGAVVRLADVALAADDPLLALRAAMTPDA